MLAGRFNLNIRPWALTYTAAEMRQNSENGHDDATKRFLNTVIETCAFVHNLLNFCTRNDSVKPTPLSLPPIGIWGARQLQTRSHYLLLLLLRLICSEDCFYYCSERNNVVVLFGTLKVQSFILTEVSDCGLLIVVTSSTFLKRKDMLKEKAVSPRSHPAS